MSNFSTQATPAAYQDQSVKKSVDDLDTTEHLC